VYFGIGPKIGFEYFVSKRFSISSDIAAFSYGLKFDKFQSYQPGSGLNNYLAQHGETAILKLLSIGCTITLASEEVRSETLDVRSVGLWPPKL
jgi:hypothetical protein